MKVIQVKTQSKPRQHKKCFPHLVFLPKCVISQIPYQLIFSHYEILYLEIFPSLRGQSVSHLNLVFSSDVFSHHILDT